MCFSITPVKIPPACFLNFFSGAKGVCVTLLFCCCVCFLSKCANSDSGSRSLWYQFDLDLDLRILLFAVIVECFDLVQFFFCFFFYFLVLRSFFALFEWRRSRAAERQQCSTSIGKTNQTLINQIKSFQRFTDFIN